jgi:hypothetical protein
LWSIVSDPTEGSSRTVTVEAGLQLRRNAARGFGVGGFLAVAVFVFFALLPGTSRPTSLYVGLAVVLGVSIGLLATILLVAWRLRRLARTL